jgi:hypothetical protein
VLLLLVDAWLGVIFAWCARPRLKEGGPWSQPSVMLMGSFVAIVLVPATTYLYLAHTAWTWLYVVNPEHVPKLAVVPFIAAAGGAVVGGWYGCVRLIRSGRQRIALGILGGGGAFLILFFLLVRHRLGSYGTYAEYHARRALPLGQVKLGYVLIALVVGVVSSGVLVGWELYKDGRRVTTK